MSSASYEMCSSNKTCSSFCHRQHVNVLSLVRDVLIPQNLLLILSQTRQCPQPRTRCARPTKPAPHSVTDNTSMSSASYEMCSSRKTCSSFCHRQHVNVLSLVRDVLVPQNLLLILSQTTRQCPQPRTRCVHPAKPAPHSVTDNTSMSSASYEMCSSCKTCSSFCHRQHVNVLSLVRDVLILQNLLLILSQTTRQCPQPRTRCARPAKPAPHSVTDNTSMSSASYEMCSSCKTCSSFCHRQHVNVLTYNLFYFFSYYYNVHCTRVRNKLIHSLIHNGDY